MTSFFFDGWQPIVRTLLIGVLAYVALIVALRVSGKRTLSKMNAFDFIVTVALGSTLATVLLSKDVSLLQGVVALALLVFLQWIVAFSAVRSTRFDDVLKSEPRLVARQGRMLEGAMKKERVTRGEIFTAMRQEGHRSLDDLEAVVLESDGSFSIIPSAAGALPVLEGVQGKDRVPAWQEKEDHRPRPEA